MIGYVIPSLNDDHQVADRPKTAFTHAHLGGQQLIRMVGVQLGVQVGLLFARQFARVLRAPVRAQRRQTALLQDIQAALASAKQE